MCVEQKCVPVGEVTGILYPQMCVEQKCVPASEVTVVLYRQMCVEQKCVPVGEVTADLCKDGCGGNGVCNSRGHCHCDPGWGPPNCLTPGDGGSEDSGPALDNSGEIPHRGGAVGGGTSTDSGPADVNDTGTLRLFNSIAVFTGRLTWQCLGGIVG